MTMKPLTLSALALALAASSAWAATSSTTTTKHHAAKKPTLAAKTEPVGQVWDWSKIDTNKDNLIEPDEMEGWLKANPGVQKGE